MKPEEKLAAARALADNPLFDLLLDELEKAAWNGCVNAAITDHDARAAHAAEARAIRGLGSKIRYLVEQEKVAGKNAPA